MKISAKKLCKLNRAPRHESNVLGLSFKWSLKRFLVQNVNTTAKFCSVHLNCYPESQSKELKHIKNLNGIAEESLKT